MGPAIPLMHHHTWRSEMKVKTNLRAGAGAKQTSKSINNTIVTYIAAISRCVGL